MRKLYLFLVLALVLLPLASATVYIVNPTATATSANPGESDFIGYKINITTSDLTTGNITLQINASNSGNTNTKWYLYDAINYTMLQNGSFASQTGSAVLTTPLILGRNYYVVYGKDAATYTIYSRNSGSYPVSGTGIDVITRANYNPSTRIWNNYTSAFFPDMSSITLSKPSPPVVQTIGFISDTLANYAIINSGRVNITTNTTVEVAYNSSIIYLYNASYGLVASNHSNNNFTYLKVAGLGGGRYYFNATAFNTTNHPVAFTETRTFFNDLTFPTITLNGNNEFNQNNVTIQNAYDKQVRLNMTFTDDNKLYGFEINVTRGSVVYYNETNETLNSTVITSLNYYRLINAASWPPGRYNISVLVSDSHTAKEIGTYEPELLDSKLKFKVHNGNVIEVSSLDESVVDTVKSLDRYDFQFDFKDKKVKDRMFKVKSTKYPIRYIEGSPYKGHFVIYGDQGGNWVDFEGVDGIPQVQKVNDFEYLVYFSNVPVKPVFKSIGGLNVYSANYSFYVGNYSFNNPQALAMESRTLWINFTKDSTITGLSANLTYDGDSYVVTETNDSSWVYFENIDVASNTTGLYDFVWNVTVYNSGGINYSFNVSSNQQVYEFGINNCTTPANTTTLTVSYWVENSPTVTLSNQMEFELTAWYSDPENTFEYSATYNNATSHTLCIFPTNVTLYADVYFKYTSATGFVHRYYLLNHSFNDTAQTLRLYNWNDTTSTSILKLTTRKLTDYSYYKNIVVALQRKYVGEGVYRNVQMDESGDFGLVNFNILERTTDYRLSFVERETGRNLKVTQDLKFVCVSGVCDLTYLLNPNATESVSDRVEFVRSYDNNTRMYVVNWSDNSGTTQTVRLFVWKNTVTGLASVCDTTQVANSGSISCNTTGYQGQAYVSLRQNGELVWGEYLDLAKVSLGSVIGEAEGGFWSLGIMVIAVAFGLFSPVAAIVAGVVGLVMIFMLGTLTVLTTTGIIIAAIVGAVLGLRLRQ